MSLRLASIPLTEVRAGIPVKPRRSKLIGVIPESESVLTASNQGTPAIHLKGTDVAEAYADVAARFLGEERPLRFVDTQKAGFLKRLFGGK